MAAAVKLPEPGATFVTAKGYRFEVLEPLPVGEACTCSHDLGAHPPDAERPFAWPCVVCDCRAYRRAEPLVLFRARCVDLPGAAAFELPRYRARAYFAVGAWVAC